MDISDAAMVTNEEDQVPETNEVMTLQSQAIVDMVNILALNSQNWL